MLTGFAKDQSLFYISAFVVSAHAILIFWMALTLETRPPIPKAAQRLVVQTVALIQSQPKPQPVKPAAPIPVAKPVVTEPVVADPEPPAPAPIPAPRPKAPPVAQVEQKPKPAKPKPKTQAKKAEKKKAKPAPVAEKKKPAAKPDNRAQIKNRELLAKAQESIAKIQATSVTIGAGQAAPRPELKIPQLKVLPKSGDEEMAGWSAGEVGFRDELASRLKLQLRLPEYGDVKIKLTLARAGRFVKVFIVSSESKANRQYIEKTIPTLTFPPFGHNFENVDEYTFSITLSNEL